MYIPLRKLDNNSLIIAGNVNMFNDLDVLCGHLAMY